MPKSVMALPARDLQLLLGLHLDGQAVAVPAETALDASAAHGLVAGNDVLDVPGEEVAVVGEAVGERRPVVEDVLVGALRAGFPRCHRRLEGAGSLPRGKDAPFESREVGAGIDAGVRGGFGHGCGGPRRAGPVQERPAYRRPYPSWEAGWYRRLSGALRRRDIESRSLTPCLVLKDVMHVTVRAGWIACPRWFHQPWI